MEHRVPRDIDSSGVSHVGDELNAWLAQVFLSDPEPTIVFPEFAMYRCEYGIMVGSRGTDRLNPDVPAHPAKNFEIRGNGAVILQRDNTTYYGPVGPDGKKVILDPRKRWGTRLLKGVDAENGVIDGLHFSGGNAQVRDSTYTPREDWLGVQWVGAKRVAMVNCVVENTWSDFLYMAGNRNQGQLCEDFLVQNCVFSGSGRQGIVSNAVDGFTFNSNRVEVVRRIVFDSEPTSSGQVTNLTITNNQIDGGGLGLMQIAANGKTPVGDIVFSNNSTTRPLIIDLPTAKLVNDDGTKEPVHRFDLAITGNQASNEAKPYGGMGAMIAVGAWINVDISGNSAWLRSDRKVPVKVNQLSSNVTVEDNDWKIAAVV